MNHCVWIDGHYWLICGQLQHVKHRPPDKSTRDWISSSLMWGQYWYFITWALIHCFRASMKTWWPSFICPTESLCLFLYWIMNSSICIGSLFMPPDSDCAVRVIMWTTPPNGTMLLWCDHVTKLCITKGTSFLPESSVCESSGRISTVLRVFLSVFINTSHMYQSLSVTEVCL